MTGSPRDESSTIRPGIVGRPGQKAMLQMPRQDRRPGVESDYPGVKYLGLNELKQREYRVRASWTNALTERRSQIEREIVASNDRAASAVLARLVAEAQERERQGIAAPSSEALSVTDCAERWLELHGSAIDKGTADRYEWELALLCGDGPPPDLGQIIADRVTLAHVQAWVNRQLQTYARSTIQGCIRTLAALVNGMRPHFGTTDPTDGISWPAAPRPEKPYAPTDEEVAALLAWFRFPGPLPYEEVARIRRCYAVAEIKVETGQRFAHVGALRVEDVDRSRRLVLFRRKVYKGHVGSITAKKPVAEEQPISPHTLAVLDEHRARLMAEQDPGYAAGWLFPGRGRGRNAAQVGPMSASTFQEIWRKGCGAVGIDADRWTQHRTRGQTYDTGRRAGVDRGTMRSLVGHGDERLQELYETVALEEKRRAVEAVRARLAGCADRSADARPENEEGRLTLERQPAGTALDSDGAGEGT